MVKGYRAESDFILGPQLPCPGIFPSSALVADSTLNHLVSVRPTRLWQHQSNEMPTRLVTRCQFTLGWALDPLHQYVHCLMLTLATSEHCLMIPVREVAHPTPNLDGPISLH